MITMPRCVESGSATGDHLDEALLRRLQAARSYPSVSVLLTTTPQAVLTSHDFLRLERLVATAERRLASELRAYDVDAMMKPLRRLVRRARSEPTGHATVLFASGQDSVLVQLPIAVADRVVVDPTFATRDLVRALALQPRLRILAVSERTARVIEGWPGHLRDISGSVLPAPTDRTDDLHGRGRYLRRNRRGRQSNLADAHFRCIAVALGRRHVTDPLPLIVAGVKRHHAFWRAAPHIGAALIGTIPGNHERTPLGRLDRLCRPIVDEHVLASQREVLKELAAGHPSRCVDGIDGVWSAAAMRRIDLLCVEDSYVFPARQIDSGRRLQPATDIEHPDVLDDAVDELIEMVALAGGRTVVVPDGSLHRYNHIAARTVSADRR